MSESCGECGELLAVGEFIELNDQRICVTCKAFVLQKQREGLMTKTPVNLPEKVEDKASLWHYVLLSSIYVIYPVVNIFSLKMVFIPGMTLLIFWGFIAPLIATVGLFVYINRYFAKRLFKMLIATFFFCLMGLVNFQFITAIWASI